MRTSTQPSHVLIKQRGIPSSLVSHNKPMKLNHTITFPLTDLVLVEMQYTKFVYERRARIL